MYKVEYVSYFIFLNSLFLQIWKGSNFKLYALAYFRIWTIYTPLHLFSTTSMRNRFSSIFILFHFRSFVSLEPTENFFSIDSDSPSFPLHALKDSDLYHFPSMFVGFFPRRLRFCLFHSNRSPWEKVLTSRWVLMKRYIQGYQKKAREKLHLAGYSNARCTALNEQESSILMTMLKNSRTISSVHHWWITEDIPFLSHLRWTPRMTMYSDIFFSPAAHDSKLFLSAEKSTKERKNGPLSQSSRHWCANL